MRSRIIIVLGVLAVFAVLSTPSLPLNSNVSSGGTFAARHASAQTAEPSCDVTPVAALPPARATWCSPTNTTGNPTFLSGQNSWVDTFDHGLTNASMGPGYVLFNEIGDLGRVQQFRTQDHWMVDVAPTYGGASGWGFAAMRPDRSFTFQNGALVVEAAVAAGVQDYIDTIWPEIVVATAPAPTSSIDDLYLYGQFGGAYAFGCRLDPERYAICDLKNDQPNTPQDDHASQTYQVSRSLCPAGATCSGGYGASQAAWNSCASTDPDSNCRDLFRLELRATSFKLYVNGVLNLEASGLPALPSAMLGGPVYTYFGQTLFFSSAQVVRFHWDRVAVNAAGGAAPSPTPTPTSTPSPSPSATPRPTTTPTPTPRPSATPTPRPSASPTPTPRPSATPTPTPRPSATPTPTPTSTPTPAPGYSQGGYTTSATVSPPSVAPGGKVTLTASVRAAASGSALVDIEVYSPSGAKVFQQVFDNQSFGANQTRTYPVTWTVPTGAAAGRYSVKIGIFRPGWGWIYHWNDQAATVTVGAVR